MSTQFGRFEAILGCKGDDDDDDDDDDAEVAEAETVVLPANNKPTTTSKICFVMGFRGESIVRNTPLGKE
jgi:hypothetical protein